jgi:hypothetical protein
LFSFLWGGKKKEETNKQLPTTDNMHSDGDGEETKPTTKPKVIDCEDWFVRLTGYHEAEWRRRSDKLIRQAEDGSLTVKNPKTDHTFGAGTFTLERLGDLVREVESSAPCRGGAPPCILEIVTRSDGVLFLFCSTIIGGSANLII